MMGQNKLSKYLGDPTDGKRIEIYADAGQWWIRNPETMEGEPLRQVVELDDDKQYMQIPVPKKPEYSAIINWTQTETQ